MEWQIETSGVFAAVTEIQWERIHLHLNVHVDVQSELNTKDFEFYGVNGLGEAKIKFKVLEQKGNDYHLTVNVTSAGEKNCIPRGTYRIYVVAGDTVLAECETAPELAPKMEECSRNFLHNRRSKVYTITFFVEDTSETLPFRMYMMDAGAQGLAFPSNPSYRGKVKPIKALKECYLSTRPVLRRIYKFYSKMYRGQREKTVLFMTEQNTVIASNLKAVSEKMIERGMDKEYNILYSARAASAEGQGKKSWIELMKKLAKSGTIFIDDHAPVLDWLKLDEDTKVIQLWHAGAGFKSSGYSRWGHNGCPAPQSCHRQYKYGIAGSRHIAHFFSEVWGINDECVLPTGMPRMDEYLDANHRKEKTEELYQQYPMCKGKKVILFAPTYRGTNKKTAYYPYELINFERLYEVCGDEYVVLFKMHPWVNEDIVIEEKYSDKFLDVKTYPNINDMFYIVDLLITDYSSNIFEYSLMRKPMLFFAYDKIQYSFSRGFHREYEESAPGKVCYTFDEVLQAIETKDFEYEKVEEYVEHHFDYIDSGASDRVIDWLLLGNMPEDLANAIAMREQEMQRMHELDFKKPVVEEIVIEDDADSEKGEREKTS